MSPVSRTHRLPEGRYDAVARRRARRTGRERGAWVYVPAAELLAAGVNPYAPDPPYYRVWGTSRGGCFLRFYRDP